MKNIYLVALTTFREFRRERFVWISMVLAMALYLLSGLLGFLSFDEQLRIFIHLGLAAMQVALWTVAAFLGGSMLSKEIERQTCLIILTRPLSRSHFYLGKMLGLLALLFQLWLILTFVILIMTFSKLPFWAVIQAAFGIFCESVLIAFFASAFASFMGSSLAVACAFVIGLIGHWLPDLSFFAEKSKDELFIVFSKIINFIIPQFHLFNFKSIAWIQAGGNFNMILWMSSHMVAWSIFLISIAVFAFSRKDLS